MRALAFAIAMLATGCNAILGIGTPSKSTDDGGPPIDATVTDGAAVDGGVDARADAGSSIDSSTSVDAPLSVDASVPLDAPISIDAPISAPDGGGSTCVFGTSTFDNCIFGN